MPPVFDKIKAGFAQRLPDGLVCRTFGMLEHFRFVLPLAVKFRQFNLVRLPVTPYALRIYGVERSAADTQTDAPAFFSHERNIGLFAYG